MPFTPYRRATLLIPSGPVGNHLFGIVSDACPQGQQILLSFSTVREGRYHDPTCLVSVGEHPFIVDPSWIVYRDARIEQTAKLTRMVESGYYQTNDVLDEDLAARMFGGVGISDHTPRYVIRYSEGI